MTGVGMCGIFIPDWVLAGQYNGKVSNRLGVGDATAYFWRRGGI
jgi:hypothetical protein